jgi:chromosome partitioning protein
MATTIAVYNIKGGVGKTATVVNLSYLAASDGFKTLVGDLDPQASATYYFRVKPKIKTGTKLLIKGGKKIDKNIKGTDYDNLDLLPSDFSFRNLDIQLDNVKRSKMRFKENLKTFFKEYKYIFLDCPPNITLVSENVFYASDIILVPIIPTTLSQRTYDKILSFFAKKKLKNKFIVPFFSMVEKRKRMHQDTMETMYKNYQGIMTNRIPYSSEVEKMGIYREPLTKKKPRTIAAEAYTLLWEEIKTKFLTT